VDWWMAGLALALLVGLGARDVGRPGVASGPALLLLRAVGGLGLVAMSALALRAGSPEGALVAAVAALPLLGGLTGGLLRARPEARPAPLAVARRRAPAAPPAAERREAA
jgi:hypothetical protein